MMTVDLIQCGKKCFVNFYIKNDELKQAWIDYVNDQTDFIHRAVDTGNKIASVYKNELEKYYAANWETETTQSNKQSQ